jgi:alpha-ketoglutarate-dependent taurine dioxygenase
MATTLPSTQLPLTIEADACRSLAALLETAQARREAHGRALLTHGALLFRGWSARSLDDFSAFVRAFSGSDRLFGYAGGASPRKALAEGGLYSSTEYPPSMTLSLHNELSYADVWPRRLFFFCLVAPREGGETTLADSRRILAAIDPAVAEEFRRRKIRYVRNLSPLKGSGYSWQEAFETDDAQEAEARCRRIGAAFEWRGNGILRMSQVRPATATHPETREEVWFNQADGFHPSALDPATYAEQLAICGSEEDFRLGVTWGDGAPIPLEALAHVRSVLAAQALGHRWREGDILVLDNLLAAHGRAPFAGPRKIALAMA